MGPCKHFGGNMKTLHEELIVRLEEHRGATIDLLGWISDDGPDVPDARMADDPDPDGDNYEPGMPSNAARFPGLKLQYYDAAAEAYRKAHELLLLAVGDNPTDVGAD